MQTYCADLVAQVNFAPDFVAEAGKADVKAVADHVDHIAKVAGRKQYVLIIVETAAHG